MTEHEWLTSTNPAEMAAFLSERITDEHQRYFVEASPTGPRYSHLGARASGVAL